MATAATSSTTRDRLLQAAVEVFVELGYRDATFREICRRAGANNAAINYHFRDKEHLYLAVIEQTIAEMPGQVPQMEVHGPLPPEEKLRSCVRTILHCLLGKGPPSWLLRLIAREMAEPTQGLDLLVEKVVAPFRADVAVIVRELAGPAASPQHVEDCIDSIMGLCNDYHHSRGIIARLGHYKDFDAATIEHLVDHITRFARAGICAVAES
jgi:AcrR family transcriptional regulator